MCLHLSAIRSFYDNIGFFETFFQITSGATKKTTGRWSPNITFPFASIMRFAYIPAIFLFRNRLIEHYR